MIWAHLPGRGLARWLDGAVYYMQARAPPLVGFWQSRLAQRCIVTEPSLVRRALAEGASSEVRWHDIDAIVISQVGPMTGHLARNRLRPPGADAAHEEAGEPMVA